MVISFHLLFPLSLSLTSALLRMQMLSPLHPSLTPSSLGWQRWQGDRLQSACRSKTCGNAAPPPPRGPLVDLALGKVPDTCDLCHPPPEVPTPGFSSYLPCSPPRAPLRWPPLRSWPGSLQLPSLLPAPPSISPLRRLLTRPTPSYQLPPVPPLHSSPHSCLCPEPARSPQLPSPSTPGSLCAPPL